MSLNYDVVVIGAGPAGAIASSKVKKEGFNVLVLEKMEFPRFVIGESLLPKSMEFFEELGMLKAIEDKKFQLKTGVTFYHEENKCEFLFSERYTEGWDYTYQVKRADFDSILIEEAKKQGVEVEFGAEVLAVETSRDIQSITYKNKAGEEVNVNARFVIDASGYGRVLPRLFNLEKPAASEPRGSVFAHVKDENRSTKASNNIFVHAYNDNTAWIWSIPFSDNTASVGIVGGVDHIKELAADEGKLFKERVRSFPGLEERFKDTSFVFEPRSIMNYAVSIDRMYGDGYVLCGNSTEFLDPIFSSGVTLAVASGYQAADLACKQLKGEDVNWEEDYVKFVQHGIEVFRSYVNAWYKGELHTIFFAQDGNPEFKKQICSVLAGYVWDKSNPFVKKHKTLLTTLAKVISMN